MKKKLTSRLADILMRTDPLHIFLDGPDGCGKSTQCILLSKALKIPINKMEYAKNFFRKGDIESESKKYNLGLAKKANESFIVDRGFTSSIVYSKVYHRDSNLNYLEDVKQALRPFVIILTATNEELFRRRPADVVIDRLHRLGVQNEYHNLVVREEYPCIDTTNKTKEEIHQEILRLVKIRYEL